MKTLLATISILLLSFFMQAQERFIEARVVDSINTPIPGVTIIDREGNQLCSATDGEGQFSLTAKSGDEFGLKKTGFDIRWSKVPYSDEKLKFVLNRKIQDLAPVVVTRKNSEEALDIFNYNIIAYQPLGDHILTLKNKRNDYFVGMDAVGGETTNYSWTKDRPKEIFFDCLSNPYILTKDSAYNFAILDTGLVILNVTSISQFRSYIMPCVAAFDQGIVHNSFADFNQTYELTIYGKEESQSVYTFTDELTYQAAWESYGKMVGTMSSQLPTGDAVTDLQLQEEMRRKRREIYRRNDVGADFQRALKRQEMKVLTEDAQANASGEGMQRSGAPSISGGVFGRDNGASTEANQLADFLVNSFPVRIKTFQLGNYMAVVNFEFDSVSIIDQSGAQIVENGFEAPAKIEQVLQDKATGHLYLYTYDDGSHKVYSLNAFTGETTFVKDFGILDHATDVRIYESKLYYRISENQFYQVNRVSLPNLKYLN